VNGVVCGRKSLGLDGQLGSEGLEMTDGEWRVQSVATTEEGVRRNGAQWWREEDNVIIIVGPRKRNRGPDTGSDAGNVCSILYIFILRIHILSHSPPSPPLLTFGARSRDVNPVIDGRGSRRRMRGSIGRS
jgi:hypothetical protein